MQQPHCQAECGVHNSSQGTCSHALPQRQWSGSSANNSTSCSFDQYPSAMDEDQQSVTPNTSSSQHHFSDHPMGMLSSSNSAPDLRLLLTTSLPDAHGMFLPTSGSYAGALVPYKGPQVGVCSTVCFIVICMSAELVGLSLSHCQAHVRGVIVCLQSLFLQH